MADRDPETFAEVKTRLDEIVEAVSDDNLSLDDALSLYEEAVSLGLRASDLLEADIDADDAEELSVESSDSVQALKTSAESLDSVQSSKLSAGSSAAAQTPAASSQGQENAAHTAAESFA